MPRRYRYSRSDFTAPLPARQCHMDLALNFAGNTVETDNTIRFEAMTELTSLKLNASELDIRAVEWIGPEGRGYAVPIDYDRRSAALNVVFPRGIGPGTPFSIRTRAACIPSDNILEGIYKDTTPPGCPQQYMSQCQQWGFQRITPALDDCRAKCTMRTTVEADCRYTHLISNGDIDRTANPDGKPARVPGNPARQRIAYVNRVPMAPYLFIVCAGTWDMLEDEVTYPSGKRVKLEYLVPPGRLAGAELPMRILKTAVLWQSKTQEYEYPYDTYRTICMEKSNWGGMENVGNTTIVTDAALIDEFTSDTRLVYAHGVIAHEFEHNQCGSDVTMATPFDMWLNEAYTEDVEMQFLADRFDPACIRLSEIDAIRNPVGGPLAIEETGQTGNIVRTGFNDPNELVDSVTYVKSGEVIRMLRLVLGDATFRKGRNIYFRRYSGGNADSDGFFACFEEAAGRSLSRFKTEWLHTIGYPRLKAEWRYDRSAGIIKISIDQTRTGKGGPFHLPLLVAAVDGHGRDIPGAARVIEVSDSHTAAEIGHVAVKPAFISFNRDCSFYGTFSCRTDRNRLRDQVRLDPNAVNRVEAMRRLADIERIRLVKDPGAEIDCGWLDLVGSIIRDDSIAPGIKAYLLRIDEQPLNRRYSTRYRALYRARETLERSVSARWSADLMREFGRIDTYVRDRRLEDGIYKRKLKGVLLRLIAAADTRGGRQAAETHFRRAWNITDKLNALAVLNRSGHPRRKEIMDEAYDMWKEHVSAYAGYLGVVGLGARENVFDMVDAEERRPTFDMRHPTFSRALYLPPTANNGMLWTDRGMEWVAETVLKLAPINETTALRVLRCLQHARRLEPDIRPKALESLKKMKARTDPDRFPSLNGRIDEYLRKR